MYDIISKRKIFYIISGITISLSLAALILWGLKFGIDFTGGSLWEFRFTDNSPEKIKVEELLKPQIQGELLVAGAAGAATPTPTPSQLPKAGNMSPSIMLLAVGSLALIIGFSVTAIQKESV